MIRVRLKAAIPGKSISSTNSNIGARKATTMSIYTIARIAIASRVFRAM
jgi:hypothetical protein